MLTQQRLKELFEYQPDTGLFIRIKSKMTNFIGKPAGHKLHGYISIEIDEKPYRAHRLVWLYLYGRWPTEHIDHINGIKDDNRLCNLREVTRSQNMMNRKTSRVNTSGLKGAYKRGNGYVSTIRHNGKEMYLGYFNTPEEAHKAYCEASELYHGEYGRVA